MPTPPARALLCLAMLTVAGAPAAAADPAALLLCRHAKLVRSAGSPARAIRPTVSVEGPGERALRLGRARTLCLPATANGATAAPTPAFAGWEVRTRHGAPPPGDRSGETITAETAFGPVAGRLARLTRALVPVAVAPGTAPLASPSDELLCHGLRTSAPGPGRLALVTALGTHDLRVERARRFCASPDTPAWVCHRARRQRGSAAPHGDLVSVATASGATVLRLGPVAEVCVPATTGPPPFTLRIEPAAQYVEWRQPAAVRAFADHPDGRSEDITDRVAWSAADDEIAGPADPPAPGHFFGRNPGTTSLVATDVATGATGQASLTVDWTLQRIDVTPGQVNRVVGQAQAFTATGTFASGLTHNVTGRVTWATGDPAVATVAPPNAPSPSRVTPVGFGTTTVSACDPLSGICSGDTGSDATLIVLGGLQWVQVRPETERSVLPGEGIRFTAVGHYADGRARNLTQQVEWSSSATAVATAANADGDRSRILGVAPGITSIRAKDPVTGIQSFPVTLFVLGDLYRLSIYPYDALGDAVRAPGSRRFTAIGEYVGGGYRNLTQHVTWHSRDPDVGIAPNTPGDRSRIDSAGSPGQARIWAEDPMTGIASDDAIFRVLGDLAALEIRTDTRRHPPFNRVPVGGLLPLHVFGVFSTGERLNFPRFFPGGHTIVSSDPSLAEIVDDRFVRGVAPGVVQLTAIDTASGFVGAPFEVLVQGDLERLVLRSFQSVLPAGTATQVQVTGHFAPGLELPYGGPLVVASSDESVATARQGPPGPRDRLIVTGIAPGTATISVTDPVTGVSSTDTGDDATITFFPNEPPVSVAVTPPVSTLPVDGFDHFTAVATFANGETLNVTQRATWTSSAPDVAEVVGMHPTGLSRTVGRSAGVAMISATYEGVGSTSSGQDGIAIVSDVLSLTVLGADTPLAVGETRALRATAQLANGRVLNVTDMLEYRSLDAGIADFLDADMPTAVTGLAAGEVDLDVGLPDSAVRTTVHLTVTDDPVTTTSTTPTTTTTTTTVAAPLPLRLEPAAQTVDFGQTTRFRALRGSVDVSETVTWSVDDAGIARADGGRLVATDPGTTAVRVLDPATGTVAAASLTVEWSLRGITLWPRQANRDVGDWERFAALGTFRRGGTAVVTDRLQYAVADPTVAALQSSAANPSEVVALQEGRTTVSACDPLTGVCSGDAGSAMLLVGGGLQAITITPGETVSHFPGAYQQYTATGHFGDGSTQDITDTVTWAVTEPGVALASNGAGTRGRVYAVAAGFTNVTATDPGTGIVSNGFHPFFTLGALQQIVVEWPEPTAAGTSTHMAATGFHAGGGTRNLSQLVEWSTGDPTVAVAPNAPADRNRIDAVGVGATTIVARDPVSGITSNPVPLTVFGALSSLQVSVRGSTQTGIGGQLTVRVVGCFDGGHCTNLTQTGGSYELLSDTPAVVEVVDAATVRGVSGGSAQVTARDPDTGVTSPPLTITVQGVLDAITLSPGAVTRALGETQAFAATGTFVPGITGLVTQQLVYASSDESVAVALNTPGNRSRVLMVGPGTAVISAVDPGTGVSSTDSGGDVTVTVLPGTFDRIVVSPPFVRRLYLDSEEFTAIGYYPDGTSLNVTQQVEWTTSNSSVAGAFGPPNRRSLFQANGPGVAIIGAVHPQGVTSSASGHDAVMEVDQVVALEMTPASRVLLPGQSAQFTVRATMASGPTVNVTQDAFYFSTSPALSVPNVPPRRSEVVAVAPGQGQVQAFYEFRGAAATVTVLGGSPSGAFL